jgi:FHS family glucose/mannose:H+ symporter-like MFS transporter
MSTEISNPELVRPASGTMLVHAAFVLTGVMTTLLGPMLPVFATRWTLSDSQAGYLFTAQFATSILGVALSSVLVHRYGYRLTLVFGLGFMAMGAGMLARASWIVGLVSVCVYGFGLGLTIPTANLLIAELHPDRRAAALNLLNFSWGIGAVGCPFVVAALQRSQRTSLLLLGMAVFLALLAISLGSIRMPVDTKANSPKVAISEAKIKIWKNRFVPVLGALFFFYVGTESSIGGWVASYARRIDTGSGTFWALTPSFFWGALLLGRALAPVMLRHVRETTLASAGLVLASLGVFVLLLANTMGLVVVGTSLAGLGLASVFPINIAMLSQWFGEMASRIGGVMFALSSLGGATVPWLVGALSSHFGSLRVGLTVPLLGSLTMLFLYLKNRKPDRLT